MHPFLRSLGGAALLACAHAQAQSTGQLGEVTVTGNPLGSTDLIAPATQLSGTGLTLRSQATLGETLNTTPGVSSTYFGPAASRPIVRGMDGDRIRVLSNGGASLDASSLSYDHAVASDPIAVERIEVLRGPGALLYGGNALGGAINLIDNRIQREPAPGVSGKVDVGYASGNRDKSAAALVEGGNARIGLHVDMFHREMGDTRVPPDLACTQSGVTSIARRICNSDARTRGAAAGGSTFFDKGYLGVSASEFRSDYGSVAEDEVRIGMRSRRYALEGELRELGGLVRSVKAQASHSNYQHTEFDAGAPGTVFGNNGNEVRLEARHAPLAGLEGIVGWQSERSRFAADGDEAFAPHSRTRSDALFLYEELGTSWGKLSLGARTERVRVESLGNPLVPRFAVGGRDFRPSSLALGGLWKLAPAWQLSANAARSERAPKDYELFADGPHVATGAYEVGNPNLPKERADQLDVGLQWKSGPHNLRVSAFASRFSNYLALLGTGRQRDAQGNGAGTGVSDCGDGTSAESGCTAELLPEYAYQPVKARLRGLEAGGTLRLHDAATTVDLEVRSDLVRADNLSTGEPLPRIAPWRFGATLVGAQGPWSARLGFDHNARQDRVPAGETPVGGYTLWHAALTYRMKAAGAQLLWYARLDNASNRLGYTATSILTQSAPGRVPLPGRSLKVGLQASF
jgi:iron complex outermembrane receptor protein